MYGGRDVEVMAWPWGVEVRRARSCGAEEGNDDSTNYVSNVLRPILKIETVGDSLR